jgi:hypothetical protein
MRLHGDDLPRRHRAIDDGVVAVIGLTVEAIVLFFSPYARRCAGSRRGEM